MKAHSKKKQPKRFLFLKIGAVAACLGLVIAAGIIFIPQLLKKYFPDWKKKDTVQLCLTILKKFKYLHDRNIILGDINYESKESYFRKK